MGSGKVNKDIDVFIVIMYLGIEEELGIYS